MAIVVALLSLIVGASAVIVWRMWKKPRVVAVAAPAHAGKIPEALVTPLPADTIAPLTPSDSTTTVATSAPTPLPTVTATATETVTAMVTATAPITATATATATAQSTARAVTVTTTSANRRDHLALADVASVVARLHSQIEACYAAPDCKSTTSPWCFDSRWERNLTWRVTINTDGSVNRVEHSGGGLQTSNCVGRALDKLHFGAYALDHRIADGLDQFNVAVTVTN